MKPVRTRFAPSPTGKLHLGGIRTALYNWLYVKKHNGKFILRIEDTDKNKEIFGSAETIERDLKWAGLIPDEGPKQGGPFGPYVQSQRLDIYKKYANILLEKKAAYRCFCTEERLNSLRHLSADEAKMYDRVCLSLKPEEVQEKMATTKNHTIRLRVPDGSTDVEDVVRGKITFQNKQVDDQILVKSDNFPTYHFANVIDDHLMQISHVIRGEEWLNSTPKHVILYDAFGWQKPHFVHLPLVLNDDKSKISKSKGDVSIESYRDQGYSIDPVLNFVAMLGWGPENSNKEVFVVDELIKEFTLERIHKNPAIYANAKLLWFSEQHFRRSVEEDIQGVMKKLRPLISEKMQKAKGEVRKTLSDEPYMTSVLKLIAGRVQKLSEMPEKGFYWWVDPEIGKSNDFYNKMWAPNKDRELIQQMITELDPITDENWNLNNITNALGVVATNRGLVPGQIYKPARYLLTGITMGATVPETMEVLGKSITMARLNRGLQFKEKEW